MQFKLEHHISIDLQVTNLFHKKYQQSVLWPSVWYIRFYSINKKIKNVAPNTRLIISAHTYMH